MKSKNIQSHTQTNLLSTNTNLISMAEKVTKLSSLKCRRHYEKPLTRIKLSSFPRYTASYTKHISSLSIRKRISNNTSNVKKSRFAEDLSVQRIIKKNLDNNLGFSKDQTLSSSLNKEDTTDIFINLLPKKTEQVLHQNIDFIPKKEPVESRLQELIKAAIIKEPTDTSVFRGSRVLLEVTYQGYPEPTVKWLQVVGSFLLLLILYKFYRLVPREKYPFNKYILQIN